jgi:TonB family protein
LIREDRLLNMVATTGSYRRVRGRSASGRACVAVVGLLAVGCLHGAPSWFSKGERWSFPLVGPLEGGLLITPVSINGHGPYLFAFDPDANMTAIDKQVVDESGLRVGSGPPRIDETDTAQVRVYAEMVDLKIANLTIDRRDAMVFAVGLYDTEGRHINGILGRDVIADSLVFGFDRDQGLAMLSTVAEFRPPPAAIPIKYQRVASRSSAVTTSAPTPAGEVLTFPELPPVPPVPRRLVTAQIGGGRFAVHLDLGAAVSQLPEARWARARLAPAAIQLRLADEAAVWREVTTAAVGTVVVGAATASQVTFVPYLDRRFSTEGVDGALGLDFFAGFAVHANWDAETYFLKRRDPGSATLARLARWGSDVPRCPHPGCITAELVAGEHGVVLQVVRDAEAANHALEVLLGVTPAPGRAAAPLVVALPSATSTVTAPLSAEYAGATLAVLDVSPFPRACPGEGGCALVIGAPVIGRSAPEPRVRSVAIDQLIRLTGAPSIPPSAEALTAASGKPIAEAIVRVCLTADGKVDSARPVKSSGVAAYDEQLQATIQATWAFAPPLDDRPAPVCTLVSFLAR